MLADSPRVSEAAVIYDDRNQPMENVDWMQRARSAFASSDMWFNASVRHALEQDYKQFQSQHPTGSVYHSEGYKGRSKLFDPKTRSTIRRNEAIAAEAFFSTDDVVTVTPEDDANEIEVSAAKMMQFLLQWRLTNTIPWFLLLNGAYQDAQKAGVVVGFVHWDKRKDKPIVEIIPPENIRIDSAASWFDPMGTSPYVIRFKPMYVKDVKAMMQSGEWTWTNETDIAASTIPPDTIRQVRQERRPDPLKQSTAITDYSVCWVHEYIMEDNGMDVVFHTLGQIHLLESPKPIEAIYAHGIRPFVMGQCVIETHKTYPSSVCKLTRDMQTAINSQINLRRDNQNFSMTKRFFVKRGKSVDTFSLRRPGLNPVTEMDNPAEDVKVVEIPDVTSSAYQEQDRLNLAFDDIAGTTSNATVQSNRKLNETVGGMNLLKADSTQVSGYQLRTFVETFVEPMLKLLVAVEAHYELNEKIINMALRAADADKLALPEGFILPDDLLMQQLMLKCNVGMGATSPVDKVNRFITTLSGLKNLMTDDVLQKLGLKIDEVIKELFGNLGYKDGKRFFDMDAADPRIAQLESTIQQLQQAMAAKWPPEVMQAQIDKLKAEVKLLAAKKVETGVKASYEAIQGAGAVAANPQLAPVADVIMAGADYQAPVPMGDDPNFPMPEVGMNPLEPGMTTNEPPQPQPMAGPGVGQAQGIETMRTNDNG